MSERGALVEWFCQEKTGVPGNGPGAILSYNKSHVERRGYDSGASAMRCT
jgi:hypothetical protein